MTSKKRGETAFAKLRGVSPGGGTKPSTEMALRQEPRPNKADTDALAALASAVELDPGYEQARMNRRVIEGMREGEPLIPNEIQSVEFYADRLRARQCSGSSFGAAV